MSGPNPGAFQLEMQGLLYRDKVAVEQDRRRRLSEIRVDPPESWGLGAPGGLSLADVEDVGPAGQSLNQLTRAMLEIFQWKQEERNEIAEKAILTPGFGGEGRFRFSLPKAEFDELPSQTREIMRLVSAVRESGRLAVPPEGRPRGPEVPGAPQKTTAEELPETLDRAVLARRTRAGAAGSMGRKIADKRNRKQLDSLTRQLSK